MTYIVQVQPRGVSAVKPKAGGEKEVRKVSGEKNLSEQQPSITKSVQADTGYLDINIKQ